MLRPNVYSSALEMCAEYHDLTGAPLGTSVGADQFRFKSGLPYSLHIIGGNEREGSAIAVVVGTFDELAQRDQGPLIRMHSACTFSEIGDSPVVRSWLDGHLDTRDIVFMEKSPSDECDCRAQRVETQKRIASEGGIYFDLVDQDGRGAGLEIKREAYKLHREEGLDTVEAYERLGVPFDSRQYGHCARFLLEKGIDRVQLLSNNPRKISALTVAGIEVAAVPLVVGVTETNVDYLRTKRDKADHLIPADSDLLFRQHK